MEGEKYLVIANVTTESSEEEEIDLRLGSKFDGITFTVEPVE